MSYYSHVRDGIYTGEDPQIAECFTQADRLRRSGRQLKAILAAGKEAKGTLNEDQYQDRLGENQNNPDELRRIVGQQEHRRAEYFRARTLLEHHLLPTVKDALTRVIETARQISHRGDAPQYWMRRQLDLDETSAICQTQSVVQGENIVELYDRARGFVAEPDETEGRGEKAFERAFKNNESWLSSFIPAEYQIIEGSDMHPLDAALQAAIAALMPKLIAFEADVAELKRIAPSHTSRGSGTLAERARWPELFDRVRSGVQMGDKFSIEGYDPGFGEKEGAGVTKAAEELRAAVATITSQPQRRLAQSNLLGLTRRVFNQIRSLETDAFNLCVGASRVHNDIYKATVTSFDQFMTKVDEAIPTL